MIAVKKMIQLCTGLKLKAVNQKQHLTYKVRIKMNNMVCYQLLNYAWFKRASVFDENCFLFSNNEDPPNIDAEALGKFTKPVIIKAGENAEWKLPFSGGSPMNTFWYKDDDELLPGLSVKIETSATESRLRLTKCQRKDSGEVKIKIKNEYGTTEATSKLIVLGKLTTVD